MSACANVGLRDGLASSEMAAFNRGRLMVDAADIIRALFLGPAPVPLGNGLTVHVIASAEAVGPGRSIAGNLVVEKPDGSMRRITGAELVAFVERNPWVKRWRIEDDEREA
jgi:hypothetical protein